MTSTTRAPETRQRHPVSTIDAHGARLMLLGAQGLLSPPTRPASRTTVLATIRRMGALQIDTISVVARSPYFVLWSRIGTYETIWLNDLLRRRRVFEYWSHAACYLPMEAYPLYRPAMGLHKYWSKWLAEHSEIVDRVRNVVLERGEVKSSDFKDVTRNSAGWWDWKPEKIALEVLFAAGEIMVSRRDGFQRVYAPTQMILGSREFPTVTEDEARYEKVIASVRHLGLAKSGWVADYFRLGKAGIADHVARGVSEGLLLQVEVSGWGQPAYVHADNMRMLRAAQRGRLKATVTTFLMPFDPVVWDRKRALELFGLEYRIEVYTPQAQRKYGYLTLPILHQDRIVGRLDAKAHRKTGTFEVRSIHLEPGVDGTEFLTHEVARALRSCAHWHGTPEIAVSGTNHLGPSLLKKLTQPQ